MHVVRKGVVTLFVFSLAFLTFQTLPRGIFREGNTGTTGDWGEEVFCSVLQIPLCRRQEVNLERLFLFSLRLGSSSGLCQFRYSAERSQRE